MSKETQRIIAVFVFILSASSFGTFVVSFIGSKWYSCRSDTTNNYDVMISLWKYCTRNSKGESTCFDLESSDHFKPVLEDFQIIRILSIITIIFSGLSLIFSGLHCIVRNRKIVKTIVLIQIISAVSVVVIGLSNLFYSSIRAQDIVGENIRYTFGWSCVISWIGTIVSLLTVILTIVLVCVYVDNLTERSVRIREELNMDNLSITSEDLSRISRGPVSEQVENNESSIYTENNKNKRTKESIDNTNDNRLTLINDAENLSNSTVTEIDAETSSKSKSCIHVNEKQSRNSIENDTEQISDSIINEYNDVNESSGTIEKSEMVLDISIKNGYAAKIIDSCAPTIANENQIQPSEIIT